MPIEISLWRSYARAGKATAHAPSSTGSPHLARLLGKPNRRDRTSPRAAATTCAGTGKIAAVNVNAGRGFNEPMPAAGNIAASVQGALASAGGTKPAGRTDTSALMSERPLKGGLSLFRASDDVAHRPLNVLKER